MSANDKAVKKSNVRYFILAMLFIVTTFNYVDRATLSMAAPAMRKDLGFDAVTMGWAMSAFGWAYTVLQIPGGLILDKYGSRLVYGLGLFLWSAFTFLQGFVGWVSFAFIALFVLRFLMGAAEAPAFPANARITATWFPTHERGFASAIFNSAQYFALAAFSPLMGWTLYAFGWPSIFFWTGAVGMVIAAYWFKVIRDPKAHKGVNQAELEYIQAGGGLANIDDKKTEVKWSYDRRLFQTG
jgi:MFS transporter, ACS family, glucarate transporter